ncbi:MAG: FG-GAP repeat domain-containing protein, partial [Planctomycetota bacterium]
MLLTLLLSLAQPAQEQDLLTRVVDVGEHPEDIVVVDLDGDGLQDLVTANWGENSISAIRQLPGRDFGTPISSLVDGIGPSLIAGGDFNGDGFGDLAVLLETSEELIVLQGDGTGQFQQVQRFAMPLTTTEVEAFDVNHDGNLDLVATNNFFNQLLVWDGLGDGTFAPAVGHTPSGIPTWISFGDMDGDGWEDVIVATCSNNAQNVFHGTPEGPLGPPSYIDTAAEQFWNEVADVNGDGKLDLFSADFGSEIWV